MDFLQHVYGNWLLYKNKLLHLIIKNNNAITKKLNLKQNGALRSL